MRLFLFITIAFLSVLSCDDGDILVVDFDFDNNFDTCGNLVFYKTRENPSESLSILINDLNFDDLFKVTAGEELKVTSSSNTFNYRTYDNATLPSDLFCSPVSNSSVVIKNDYQSTNNNAIFTVTLTEDDDDGIPANLEDLNGDGNLDNDDTDGDGIPNYLDQDDDGDNVYTASEGVNYTEEDGLSKAQDTDGDGTPDYLDSDDDQDGVLTRDEESVEQNNNPTDDIRDPNVGADYLNKDVALETPAVSYREHRIKQTFNVGLEVMNVDLSIISQNFDFGTLDSSAIPENFSSRTVTPEFNN